MQTDIKRAACCPKIGCLLGLLFVAWALNGCASWMPALGSNPPPGPGNNPNSPSELPQTPGERSAGYGYIPLDGLAVQFGLQDQSCLVWNSKTTGQVNFGFKSSYDFAGALAGKDPYKSLFDSLPDITVRFAVAEFDASGGLTFGPAKVTVKNTNYRAVLDYVNVDVIPVTMLISATKTNIAVPLGDAIKMATVEPGSNIAFTARTLDPEKDNPGSTRPDYESKGEPVTIPVYVGMGLRLSADIRALAPGVSLTSLGSIGADAQANRLSGTLTVQTIGITGESINTAVPLPSTLDQTTIENGILSIGSIRAVVYKSKDDDSVVKTPRVVGMFSPIGSTPALVNAIYAELSRNAPKWNRPCVPLPAATQSAAPKPKSTN